MRKFFSLLVTLFAFSFLAYSQTTEEITSGYSFIVDSLDHLQNDTALNSFFEKLNELQNGKRKTVTVVQIGDSHIQADFFSGVMREKLQRKFGNAGRGLIFPYRVAKTNEPKNFYTSSNVSWEAKRNVFPNIPLPIGVSGITIRSYDSAAAISFNIYDADSLNYAFNHLKIFHYKAPDAYDMIIADANQSNVALINSKITTPDFFTSDISLRDTMHQFQLRMLRTDSFQNQMMIYGVELENGDTGLLYDMIGVNGAMYSHYDSSVYFVDQLISLHPDLIIVSLGTNDAYAKYFTESELNNNMSLFISKMRAAIPDANFLLTSPPDGYRYHKYKNVNVAKAVSVMKYYCANNNCSFWDFYHLMGGFGSIYKWYRVGLAQKDLLHLTARGYKLQADLLYNAIMNSYSNWKSQSQTPK